MPLADLTDLASVKAWLGIATAVTTSDALLASLISRFSQATRTYCCQTFDLATYTERRDGTGNPRILLREQPVVSASSVTASGVALPASDGSSTGYLVDGEGIGLVMIGGGTFPKGVQNLVITYSAGYQRTGTDSLPGDLKNAVTEWVGFAYREMGRIGEASKSIGPESVGQFITDAMPTRVALVLNIYARRTPL